MKKRKGQIGFAVSCFIFAVLFLLIAYEIQIHKFDATKTFTEDALAASNLASAVIDLQEYGISHDIVIKNPDSAFALWQEALKINMGLDEKWESQNKLSISGKVEILDYVIYNVRGTDVEVYSFGQTPYTTVVTNGLGSVESPNGILIESTSIYSRITFPVEGILNVHVTAEKDKLVDIVNDKY